MRYSRLILEHSHINNTLSLQVISRTAFVDLTYFKRNKAFEEAAPYLEDVYNKSFLGDLHQIERLAELLANHDFGPNQQLARTISELAKEAIKSREVNLEFADITVKD